MLRYWAKYLIITLFFSINNIIPTYSVTEDSYVIDSAARKLIVKMYSDMQQLGIDSNRLKINQALKRSKSIGDQRVEADIYNLIGDYYNRNFINDSAIKYFKKALEVGKSIDYNRYFPDLGYKIANTYWDIGDYSFALEMALQLKSYYEYEGTLENHANILNLLGIIYLKLLDFTSALENLELAAKACEAKNNRALLGVVYANTGNLYYRLKQYSESLNYYEKGVALEVENKEYKAAGRSYEAIANLFLSNGEFGKVANSLEKALNYNAQANDIVGKLRTFSTYGKYYNAINEYSEAIKFLKEAEEMAIKSDSKEYYMKTCEQFSIAYKSLNNYSKAFNYQAKYLELYKEIYNIQEFSGIKKLEHELRIEKKNNEISRIEIEKKRYVNLLLIVIVILSIGVGCLFMVMYFRSISTKRSLIKMNEEINRQKEELERANVELDEARILAENANELKSHFLRNITHEIRTPLNGIVGISEVLVNNESSDIKFECLQMIKDNSSKLIYAIDNLVEMAHITSNQVKTQFELVDPKLFIDEIYNAYVSRFDFCKGKVDFEKLSLSNDNIQIKTDAKLLRKIVEQLIENSIKFTKEGSISIGCKIEDGVLHFFVRDTGVGISKDSQSIIFESFRQEQEGSIREYEGVGIGLTIAKKLSELLGAELWFESKKDQGAIFYISFNLELS